MRWREDLQVKLRERYRRIYTASINGFTKELGFVAMWIQSQPALALALEEAHLGADIPKVEEWIDTQNRHSGARLPGDTEEVRAAFVWDLMQHLSSMEDIRHILYPLTHKTNYADGLLVVVEQFIQPLFGFLGEQIGDGSSILYSLERYVRQLEWFDKQGLYNRFQANTHKGEETYDLHLREFLFREGFDMPFSQVKSPSGLSDVIAELDSEDPLICELKLYDGDNRNVAHLASGVTQAISYAIDHGKHAAHLVIINLSTHSLMLPTDGPADFKPPYLDVSGTRVYLIQARGLPRESASKRGRTDVLTIARDQLTSDIT